MSNPNWVFGDRKALESKTKELIELSADSPYVEEAVKLDSTREGLVNSNLFIDDSLSFEEGIERLVAEIRRFEANLKPILRDTVSNTMVADHNERVLFNNTYYLKNEVDALKKTSAGVGGWVFFALATIAAILAIPLTFLFRNYMLGLNATREVKAGETVITFVHPVVTSTPMLVFFGIAAWAVLMVIFVLIVSVSFKKKQGNLAWNYSEPGVFTLSESSEQLMATTTTIASKGYTPDRRSVLSSSTDTMVLPQTRSDSNER